MGMIIGQEMLVIDCAFYLSLLHVLNNRSDFGDFICQFGGREKRKRSHLSPASHHSTMNAFFAHLLSLLRSSLFPRCRRLLRASSASISAAILSRHAQKSGQERQQGRGGGRLVHGHCHLPSSPLSLPFPLRGSLWGCLAMASNNGNNQRLRAGPSQQQGGSRCLPVVPTDNAID